MDHLLFLIWKPFSCSGIEFLSFPLEFSSQPSPTDTEVIVKPKSSLDTDHATVATYTVSRLLAFQIDVGFHLEKINMCAPSWIAQRIEVLYFKHKIRLKNWLSRVPNGMVIKKRPHFTHNYRTHVRTFDKEDKKRRGSSITCNFLARSSNVDGKCDRWSLVAWLLGVCGHLAVVFRNKPGSKTP